MMYEYHYQKISLQLTHDPALLRVILSMRNKLHSQSKYKFSTWNGCKAEGGPYVTYDNVARGDRDDEVSDKSQADGRPGAHALKPVSATSHPRECAPPSLALTSQRGFLLPTPVC